MWRSAKKYGFNQAKIDHFFANRDRFLPLCKDKLGTVVQGHAKRFPSKIRTMESLRWKFVAFHRRWMSTGDLLMPANVLRAKYIRYKMTERADTEVIQDAGADEVLAPDGFLKYKD